jgi:hypothetical protein
MAMEPFALETAAFARVGEGVSVVTGTFTEGAADAACSLATAAKGSPPFFSASADAGDLAFVAWAASTAEPGVFDAAST